MVGTKRIKQLKQEYIEYFEDVPVQKYAAMAIGRDEDTIIRWKKEDEDFADAVQRAKAEWVRKKVLATKAEFALERLEREVFSQNLPEIKGQDKYTQYVQNNIIDPNSSHSKKLVEASLTALMQATKRKK
jgi:hypothetical protein